MASPWCCSRDGTCGPNFLAFLPESWQWNLGLPAQTKKCTNLSQSSIASFTCAFSRRWRVGIPRYDHLYMEEDFMKHVGRICSKCHPSTLHMVSLYRYRALIELAKEKNLRLHAVGSGASGCMPMFKHLKWRAEVKINGFLPQIVWNSWLLPSSILFWWCGILLEQLHAWQCIMSVACTFANRKLLHLFDKNIVWMEEILHQLATVRYNYERW